MESTKIQALWNLCSELKLKRQQLLEQWKSTQGYLDYQQDLLEREFLTLRDHNQGLAETLSTLHGDLHQLRAGWQEHISRSLALQQEFSSLDVSYAELNSNFSSLQRELHGLHQELSQQAEQSQELAALQDRFTHQQNELTTISQDYQQQRGDLQALLQEKTVQQGKVGELKQELQALRTRFSDVNGSIAQVFADLSSYQKSWRQERESRVQAYEQLKTDYAQLEAELTARQTEVTELSTELEARQTEVTELGSELADAAMAREQLQHSLATKSQALTDAETAHQQTQVQAAATASELLNLQGLRAELATQLDQLKEQLAALQAQLADHEQNAYVEREQHAAQQAELQASLTALEAAKTALEAAKDEQIEVLDAELGAEQQKTEALQTQLTEAQSESESLQRALKTAHADADTLREQLADAEAQGETLQTEGQALQAQVSTQTERIHHLEQLLEQAHEKTAELSAQLAQQQAQYAALEAEHQTLVSEQTATQDQLSEQQESHQQLQAELAQAVATAEQQRTEQAQVQAALTEELQTYATQAARIPQAQTLINNQNARLAAMIVERESHLPPLRAEFTSLAAEQEQLAQQALAQHQSALQLQQQIQDLQQEIARKDKLLAQLEGVEQSDAIRSAREGLTAEIRVAREQIVALVEDGVAQDNKAEVAREQERASSLRFRQVQQSVALAEQELATAQAYTQELAHIAAALTTEQSVPPAAVSGELTALHARLGHMEGVQATLAQDLEIARQQNQSLEQDLQQAQAEQQAKTLQASQYQSEIEILRRKLLAKEHELQQQAERLSQPPPAPAFEVPPTANPQVEVESQISEQVDQISSLLSELNLGFAGGLMEDDAEEDILDEDEFEAEEIPAKPRQRQILIYSESVAEKEDWSQQLQTYLQEFSLGCQWVNGKSLPELASASVKGLVFLVEPSQNPNPDLMRKLQQQGIPFVKHHVSNVTRLKIDILDAFIR